MWGIQAKSKGINLIPSKKPSVVSERHVRMQKTLSLLKSTSIDVKDSDFSESILRSHFVLLYSNRFGRNSTIVKKPLREARLDKVDVYEV